MKKSRIFLLVILYCLLFIITITLQWFSVHNSIVKLLLSLGTIIMAGITFGMLLIQNKANVSHTPKNMKTTENEIQISKDEYLSFANKCKLTKREKEIGYLVLNGYSNARLSEELYISEATVKKHLSHIYEKTKTTSRKDFRELIRNFCSV